MKKLTLILEDDALFEAIECEAVRTGLSIEEVAINALDLWRMDSELDAEERQLLEQARSDWERNGGVEASTFFDNLRDEERAPAR